MSRIDELEAEALALVASERARLARVLLQSLDEPSDAEIEAEWVAVAERRLADIHGGSATTIPAEQVLQEAREP